MNTYVLPAKDVLSGKGAIWEWRLSERGWNDLSPEKKRGRIVGWFKLLESDAVTCDVLFEGADYTATNVFPDELRRVDNGEMPTPYDNIPS